MVIEDQAGVGNGAVRASLKIIQNGLGPLLAAPGRGRQLEYRAVARLTADRGDAVERALVIQEQLPRRAAAVGVISEIMQQFVGPLGLAGGRRRQFEDDTRACLPAFRSRSVKHAFRVGGERRDRIGAIGACERQICVKFSGDADFAGTLAAAQLASTMSVTRIEFFDFGDIDFPPRLNDRGLWEVG